MNQLLTLKTWWIKKTSHTYPKLKKIYIRPTRLGVFFFLIIFILFSTSLTYGQSLSLSASFFVLSFIMINATLTQRQLKKAIQLNKIKKPIFPSYIFAKEQYTFPFKTPNLKNDFKGTWSLNLKFSTNVFYQKEQNEFIFIERGNLFLKGFFVEFIDPFGLFLAWTWIEYSKNLIVCPAIIKEKKIYRDLKTLNSKDKDEWEFQGLRPYQWGDKTSQISWKFWSKTQTLLTHQFSKNTQQDLNSFDFFKLTKKISFVEALGIASEWLKKSQNQNNKIQFKTLTQTYFDRTQIALFLATQNQTDLIL